MSCDFDVAEFEYGERLTSAERELEQTCPKCWASYLAELGRIPNYEREDVIIETLGDHIYDSRANEVLPCVYGWLTYPIH